MKMIRTGSSNSDFQKLCHDLDNELHSRYGKSQSEYDRHNVLEENQTVLVGYVDDTPAASGCFKAVDEESVEIKRMFVEPRYRRKGLSTKILASIENWVKELNYSIAILETGKGQPEAIELYRKAGYRVTENYGPYAGIENSVCMKKKL